MLTPVDRLRLLLVRELRTFIREIEWFPDDESVWATVPGITNSAGNLALHVCGNLQHFVGRVLGRTMYVRTREAEFSRRSGTRADLVRELETTIDVIEWVLPTLGDDVLARPYPEVPGGSVVETQLFLMHLAVHLGLHLGQAGYIRRAVTGDARSTTPVPVSALAQTSS